jgi:uncharacterized protein YbbC (DUF1343 family)
MLRNFLIALTLTCSVFKADAQTTMPGAANFSRYEQLLNGKRVAVVINQTSRVGDRLLADTLIRRGIKLTKIFVPEHGFRGTGDAGAHINNSIDSATGLPIVSLYGANKKPSAQALENVDVVLYDLQDVGARFYTYISTLQYVMEACAENSRSLIVLDRPNPMGGVVDGPILDPEFKSFVGMQSIPVLYGMTPGEYAKMLIGERWIKTDKPLKLDVVSCLNWDHRKAYELPVAPSPNLKTMDAVYLYPSICFFEGTAISVGRGTKLPFQQWGAPKLRGIMADSFRPVSTPGATNPPHEGQTCYGRIATPKMVSDSRKSLQIGYLLEMYSRYPEKDKFFIPFFEKLSGTRKLREQIISGATETEIRASWEPGLKAFRVIRAKYLLYKDA